MCARPAARGGCGGWGGGVKCVCEAGREGAAALADEAFTPAVQRLVSFVLLLEDASLPPEAMQVSAVTSPHAHPRALRASSASAFSEPPRAVAHARCLPPGLAKPHAAGEELGF